MESMCAICHYPTEEDDFVLSFSSGKVICLRCQERTVGDERKVSKRLRREIATEEDELRGAKLPVDPRLARLKGENALTRVIEEIGLHIGRPAAEGGQ